MDKNRVIALKSQFDSILHVDAECDIECWYARELQVLLGYTEWRNFLKVIEKAKESCHTVTKQSKLPV